MRKRNLQFEAIVGVDAFGFGAFATELELRAVADANKCFDHEVLYLLPDVGSVKTC